MNVNETVSAWSVLVTATFAGLHSADGILKNIRVILKLGARGC